MSRLIPFISSSIALPFPCCLVAVYSYRCSDESRLPIVTLIVLVRLHRCGCAPHPSRASPLVSRREARRGGFVDQTSFNVSLELIEIKNIQRNVHKYA